MGGRGEGEREGVGVTSHRVVPLHKSPSVKGDVAAEIIGPRIHTTMLSRASG